MTVYQITDVIEMVEEHKGTSLEIVKVYEYTNAYNQEVMYACFTAACYDDVHESPAVDKPILIFENGEWYREYTYLNRC